MEFHCHIRIGKTSNGQNCVGRCAYIQGEKLTDENTGELFDHTSKEEVIFRKTYLPDHAPKEWAERPQTMWSKLQNLELSGRTASPRLYREFEIALPNELSKKQEIKIVESICKNLNDQGMCLTVGIHNKNDNGKKQNNHVHILASLRRVDENGNFMAKSKKTYALDKDGNKIPILDKNGKQKIEKKTGRKLWLREEKSLCWDNKDFVKQWREMICREINKELPIEHRLDYRSFKDRGIDKIPQIHHYGIPDRIAINEKIIEQNQQIEKIKGSIAGLQKLLDYEERKEKEHGRDNSREINGNPRGIGADKKHPMQSIERSTDSGARKTDYILRATNNLADRKQREALEADRERERIEREEREAQRREREAQKREREIQEKTRIEGERDSRADEEHEEYGR